MFDGLAHMIGNVAGNESVGSLFLDSDVASLAVNIDAEHYAPIGSIALSNECGNDTCEHITTASGGHARVAAAVDIDLSVGADGHGVVPLEHDGDFVEFRHIDGFLEPLLVAVVQAEEAVKLDSMGCDD